MERVGRLERVAVYGRVIGVVGLVIEVVGLDLALGELCRIHSLNRGKSVLAEVVGFRERGVLLMPLGELEGVGDAPAA